MKAMTAVHLRWMIRLDMPQVMCIENATRHPWTEDEFTAALRQRNCIGMVAEAGDTIVGFMLYELHPNHLRVVNLAVHPEHQGRGVGELFVERLTSRLSILNRKRLLVTVRESNLGAQLFFRATGFKAKRMLRGHYDDGEGGIEMEARR